MKRSAFRLALLVAAIFVSGTALAAPPDNVVLKKTGKTKPAVLFAHKAHGETYLVACGSCHHRSAKGAEKKCSACHGAKAKGKKLGLKDAFHAQCKGCHEKQKKGPATCVGCHKPKKK